MTVKEFAVILNDSGTASLFQAAKRVPTDKLTWKPLDSGRSVIDILQECAQSPFWAIGMLQNRTADFDMSFYEKMEAERKTWTTVELCEQNCRTNLKKLYAAIDAFPESDLDQKLTLPFAKDLVMTYAEIMVIHYWNATYHFGQVCYIQTLYGDMNMS